MELLKILFNPQRAHLCIHLSDFSVELLYILTDHLYLGCKVEGRLYSNSCGKVCVGVDTMDCSPGAVYGVMTTDECISLQRSIFLIACDVYDMNVFFPL